MKKIIHFSWDEPDSIEYQEFFRAKEEWLNKGFEEACKELKYLE